MVERTIYFVSESTGITAETLGHSLISQFEQKMAFKTVYMPYINTREKAYELIDRFSREEKETGYRPIVFATMAEAEIRDIFQGASCLYIELFATFVETLSDELGISPSGQKGLSHGMANGETYEDRMSIINFAMVNDDGARMDKFDQADVILVGVSRSGKTPTCLYLAMHFGVKAANYPLTPEDFENDKLPDGVTANREKLVALTIDPYRLNRIREARRPGSGYASIARCQSEVKHAHTLFQRLRLPIMDTTSHSIEEISSRIMKKIRSA